jgi:hypothetical protein
MTAPAGIIAFLRSVPGEVESLCAGLPEDGLRRRPAGGGWSAIEIICHLRDSAAEEGLRIRQMLEEDNPTLTPYDPDAWAAERRYQEEDVRRALTALRAFFTGLAYQLERLPAAAWERPGLHPESGPTSVRQRAEAEVSHAQEHLAQLRRLLAQR